MEQAWLAAQARVVEPLLKVLPATVLSESAGDDRPRLVVPGERVSVQVAFQAGAYREFDRTECTVHVVTQLDARAFLVRLVPCELPAFPDHDDDYLLTSSGLLPDVLVPLDGSAEITTVRFLPRHWQTVWIEIDVPVESAPGPQCVSIEFRDEDRSLHASATVELTVVTSVQLTTERPAFAHTEWLHVDCLADAYGVEIWSEEHWAIVENYVDSMVAHSVDTLFTPLFTPPIDIKPGFQRKTAQLVGVVETDAGFRFDFTRLHRWIDLAERAGMRRLEFAPLFTQWGAAHAPKVVVSSADPSAQQSELFGWHTHASSEEYRRFLDALLPQVVDLLRERGWHDRCFFHISDEPDVWNIHKYRQAREVVERHLGNIPIRDATSEVKYVRKGILTHPVAGIEKAEEFLEAGAEDVWAYTSVAHRETYSNTYIALPAVRTRIIGVQLFRTGISGYLRWGYNFWRTQYSRRPIDPYRVTDAGCAFPSGDPFLVYPGSDGHPVASLRLKYLAQAADDYRLLAELAGIIGKPAVDAIIDETAGARLTMADYPREPNFFDRLRRAVLQHPAVEQQQINAGIGV